MRAGTVDVSAVVVNGRHRQDLGKLSDLMESIQRVGLLHPPVVTRDLHLIAGQRRLEACRKLGWKTVPVRIADDLTSAADLLAAERDENTCRKDMTGSELYALGKALEQLERPKTRERQGGSGRFGDGFVPSETKPSDTSKVVGEAVGMSRSQWQRLKHVMARAEEGDAYAAELAAKVDAGEMSVSAADKALRAADAEPEPKPEPTKKPGNERSEQIATLARQGHRADQIADQIGISTQRVRQLARQHDIALPDEAFARARKLDHERILDQTIQTLEGLALGLDLLETDQTDPAQAEARATSLNRSLAPIKKLAKQLKEMARDHEG